MVKNNIKDRISDVNSFIEKNPEYYEVLSIHNKMLENLLFFDESIKKGRLEPINNMYINDIIEKTMTTKHPMIDYLKISEFNKEELTDTIVRLILLFLKYDTSETGLKRIYEAFINNELSILDGFESFILSDPEWFEITGKQYNVEPSLLLMIFSSPLQPFFEDLARHAEERFKETWWESYCPVCGRQPDMAIKRKMKQYMVCKYCGMEYLFDMFKCINCENTNPNSMGFVKINKTDNYEINYCDVCKNYITVYQDNANINTLIELQDIMYKEKTDTFMRDFFSK